MVAGVWSCSARCMNRVFAMRLPVVCNASCHLMIPGMGVCNCINHPSATVTVSKEAGTHCRRPKFIPSLVIDDFTPNQNISKQV